MSLVRTKPTWTPEGWVDHCRVTPKREEKKSRITCFHMSPLDFGAAVRGDYLSIRLLASFDLRALLHGKTRKTAHCILGRYFLRDELLLCSLEQSSNIEGTLRIIPIPPQPVLFFNRRKNVERHIIPPSHERHACAMVLINR